MQTLDVRIKLTPSVVRETYGNFERREEEEVVVEGERWERGGKTDLRSHPSRKGLGEKYG